MLLHQIAKPLIVRHDALQCAIADIGIRPAAVEARHRPCCAANIINHGDDHDSPRLFAIGKGAQLGHDQTLDLVLGLGELVHDADVHETGFLRRPEAPPVVRGRLAELSADGHM